MRAAAPKAIGEDAEDGTMRLAGEPGAPKHEDRRQQLFGGIEDEPGPGVALCWQQNAIGHEEGHAHRDEQPLEGGLAHLARPGRTIQGHEQAHEEQGEPAVIGRDAQHRGQACALGGESAPDEEAHGSGVQPAGGCEKGPEDSLAALSRPRLAHAGGKGEERRRSEPKGGDQDAAGSALRTRQESYGRHEKGGMDEGGQESGTSGRDRLGHIHGGSAPTLWHRPPGVKGAHAEIW